ncbi:MAG: 50S ribosomal protein L6 [Patescibacteria group bacterium]
MSRIGKQIINIPSAVTVTKNGDVIVVKGPQGELSKIFKSGDVAVNIDGQTITLALKKNNVSARSLWGTYASHLKNMIAGAEKAYQKKLILEGVGFKSEVSGANLVLALGFSHPIKVSIPADVKVTAEKNVIIVSGADKEKVGEFTAKVRALKKPEPYKGKGFRYDTEVIRRKQGKKSA